MIRGHLDPVRAAASLAFVRIGLAARALYFRATRNEDAAESCRGFLLGMRKALDGSTPFEVDPGIEIVRPPASSGPAEVSQAPRDMKL